MAAGLVVLAACSRESAPSKPAATAETSQPQAQHPSPFIPTASIQDLMVSEIMPAAADLWNSVAISSTEKGVEIHEPKNDAEWEALRQKAIILVEASNLLVIKGRNVASPDVPKPPPEEGSLGPQQVQTLIRSKWNLFVSRAHDFHAAALAMLKAVEAHDAKAITEHGGRLDEACEACHSTFWYPPAK